MRKLTFSDLSGNEKILVRRCRAIDFIAIKNIIRVESMRAYSKLYLQDGNSIILTCPLKVIFERLSCYSFFFRCHKSHLINLLYVKSYHADNGITLEDTSVIPISQGMKSVFIQQMEQLITPQDLQF